MKITQDRRELGKRRKTTNTKTKRKKRILLLIAKEIKNKEDTGR